MDTPNSSGRTHRHLSSAFLEVGDEVIFGRPTFHLYRLEALRMGGDAQGIARALEGRGVIVRPLDAMGDPASIRITVGTAQEVDVFLRAFAAVLGRSGTGSPNPSRINS